MKNLSSKNQRISFFKKESLVNTDDKIKRRDDIYLKYRNSRIKLIKLKAQALISEQSQ
jgi:hypothetical protein